MQPLLFDLGSPDQPAVRFNGPCYNPELDRERLTKQMGRVWEALCGGKWLTLEEIAGMTGDPQASISAQIRHLRKKRFGAHQVDKRLRGDPKNGLWEYCLRR